MSLDVDGAEAVARHALESWDLEVHQLSLLKLSENQTFRVDTRSGDKLVVRVHRPGYSTRAELESEHLWIDALASDGFGVPLPVLARDGSGYVEVDSPDGPRQVGVITWIDGPPMADVLDQTDDAAAVVSMYGQLGAQMARLHNQTELWDPPAGFTRRSWDIDGLLGESAHWGQFWAVPQLTAADADVLVATRDRLRSRLAAFRTSPSCYGLIHADLHIENVLVSNDGLVVIDFDDSGYGWHMYDFAVALSYQRRSPSFKAVFASAVDGYRSERGLEERQLATIEDFFMIRSLVAIGWTNDRPELDGYEHLDRYARRVAAESERYLAGESLIG